MINYKLAKQLKEVGFPQEVYGEASAKGYASRARAMWLNQDIYIPTLSELIEACGDEFGMVEMFRPNVDRTIWYARGYNHTVNYEGKTPEEAVAKLYIKLNENTQNTQKPNKIKRSKPF